MSTIPFISCGLLREKLKKKKSKKKTEMSLSNKSFMSSFITQLNKLYFLHEHSED